MMETILPGIAILGYMIAIIGWGGVVLVALRHSMLWATLLLIFPYFPYFMLAVDPKETWRPLAVNLAGSIVGNLALGIYIKYYFVADGLLFKSHPASTAVGPLQGEPGAVPKLRGVYIPEQDPGFLATADPMLLALIGGIIVFACVAMVVGLILIFRAPEEEQADTKPTEA